MASGMKVNKECTPVFDELKMKKMHRYILYKLNDTMTEIIVDETGARDETYDDFKNKLLAVAERQECRYAVFDLDFMFNGQEKNKIIFFAWNPENAKTKPKMIYTSSKDYLKKALQLVIEVQATDADEISLETATERAQRTMKD